ncbi:MAG: 13E12 repeat family protein, partial [Salinibacterium sp.]|nr:13E12 repeat family protein [Salinibacterium sp.]
MSILEAPVSDLQIAADVRFGLVAREAPGAGSLDASRAVAIEVSLAALDAIARECAAGMQTGAAAATDDALLDYQRRLAASARQLELAAAAAAAEISHRSRRELGYSGLAQKRGARTPEALVQRLTGMSGQASRRLVRVGSMVAELIGGRDGSNNGGAIEPATPAWLAPAIRAVADGIISSEVVDAVRAGLGEPSDSVSTDALAEAACTLVAESVSLTLEALARRARELRDELDAAGVAWREQERRDRRYLRLFPQADGMTRIVGLLDP